MTENSWEARADRAPGRYRAAATCAAACVFGSALLSGCASATATLQVPSQLKDGQFTGQDVPTRYGDVQVQITVSNGRITDVQAPVLPNDRARSVEISQAAGPMLHDEVLRAVTGGTAQIDVGSGATYTSDGYVQSLQSAIDQAHP
jgi:uncharacterized protein with FMN-binding domain